MRIALVAAGTLAVFGANGQAARDAEVLSNGSRVRAAFLGGASSDVFPDGADDDVSREEELTAREFYDSFTVANDVFKRRSKVKDGRSLAVDELTPTPEEIEAERIELATREPNKVRNG